MTESRMPLGFAGGTERSEERMRALVMEEVNATFKPEFLNRIDETIVFHRLSHENMYSITLNLISRLAERFGKLGLRLNVPEETARFLAQRGYDEKYGARPLRRTLQRSIEDPAAELLLKGDAPEGSVISALLKDGEIELSLAL